MAKKTQKKKTAKRYAGKTRNEWRDLGEQFGKAVDSESKSFSKALSKAGRDLEKSGNQVDMYWKSWWFDAMGLIGPVIKSIIGITFFLLGILILNFFNSFLSSGFVTMLSGFLYSNVQWFFIASLFFGYCKYFSLRKPWKWWMFSPSVNALNVVFVIWVLASILGLIGGYVASGGIIAFSGYVIASLPVLAVIIAVVGYALELTRKATIHMLRK